MSGRWSVVAPGRMLVRAVVCASVVLGLAACNSPIEVPPGATAAPAATASITVAPAAGAPEPAPGSASTGAAQNTVEDRAEFVARCLSDAGTPFRPSAADMPPVDTGDGPDPVTDPDLLVDPGLLADQAAFDANQARCDSEWFEG